MQTWEKSEYLDSFQDSHGCFPQSHFSQCGSLQGSKLFETGLNLFLFNSNNARTAAKGIS